MPEAGRQALALAVELRFTDGVAADQQRQFDHQLNFARQERPFLPIQPNPYLPGTPLQPGDFFAGRGELLRFVQDNLAHASRSSLIVLQGVPRSGKTSLLNQLPGALAATHWAVRLGLQGHPAQNEADFLYALADEIVFALSQQGIGGHYRSRRRYRPGRSLPNRPNFSSVPAFCAACCRSWAIKSCCSWWMMPNAGAVGGRRPFARRHSPFFPHPAAARKPD
jgi:hypothetical protein